VLLNFRAPLTKPATNGFAVRSHKMSNISQPNYMVGHKRQKLFYKFVTSVYKATERRSMYRNVQSSPLAVRLVFWPILYYFNY